MKPRPGDEPESLESLKNRHLDEVWELEMAEEAHDRAHEGDVAAEGRLQHYLHALRRHYGRRTPAELSPSTLITDAQYLRHRYDRMAGRIRRMIDPQGLRHDLAFNCAHHHTAWRVHFKSACDAHTEFIREVREAIRYWTWVRAHERLPGRLAFRLNPFNTRSIAHPWLSISEPVMETIALLDAEIHHHAARMTGGHH